MLVHWSVSRTLQTNVGSGSDWDPRDGEGFTSQHTKMRDFLNDRIWG